MFEKLEELNEYQYYILQKIQSNNLELKISYSIEMSEYIQFKNQQLLEEFKENHSKITEILK